MSPKTASSCARTNAGGSSWIAVTADVFCAVSATSTDVPYTPAAANAFRSAWMPAPPPESDVAIVSARGTIRAPFAGTSRIRFDGCDLSRARGTPAGERYRLPVLRLPPALAAQATPRVLELIGPPPAEVLELGFAGIHAEPLRIAGYEVTVVEPDPAYRARAAERAGAVLERTPRRRFDAVVAPAGADLTDVDAARTILVEADGTVVG